MSPSKYSLCQDADRRAVAYFGDHVADFAPFTMKMSLDEFRKFRPRAVFPPHVQFVFIQEQHSVDRTLKTRLFDVQQQTQEKITQLQAMGGRL